jgi:hypothetical protein
MLSILFEITLFSSEFIVLSHRIVFARAEWSVQLISHAKLKRVSRGANNYTAGQEIPRTSLSPKVQYCILNRPPPVSILSQIIPVHALQFRIFKKHFNFIPLYTPGCYK